MSRESSLIVIGIIVGLSPYLGLPRSFLEIFLPLFGLSIIIIGITLRRRARPATPSVIPAPSQSAIYETQEA